MKNKYKIQKRILNNKSVSLLELLVTLGIMVILLTMISNVFVEVMRINILNKERTFVREESAILIAQIKKDIRNADRLIGCKDVEGSTTGQMSNQCSFALGGNSYRWSFEPATGDFSADGYIAKKFILIPDGSGGYTTQQIYTSPEGILFDGLDETTGNNKKVFTVLTDPTNNDGQLTIVIKLISKSQPGTPGEEPAVKNVIKQTIVSARNFSSN